MSRKNGLRTSQTNKNGQNNQVEIVSQEDNNPLPPVEQLERLHSFRPDLVDKVVDAALKETEYRHKLESEQFEFFKSEYSKNRWTVGIITVSCLVVTIILGTMGRELSALGTCFFPIAIILTRLFKR